MVPRFAERLKPGHDLEHFPQIDSSRLFSFITIGLAGINDENEVC